MKNRLETKSILKELKKKKKDQMDICYFFFFPVTAIFRILRYYKEVIFKSEEQKWLWNYSWSITELHPPALCSIPGQGMERHPSSHMRLLLGKA